MWEVECTDVKEELVRNIILLCFHFYYRTHMHMQSLCTEQFASSFLFLCLCVCQPECSCFVITAECSITGTVLHGRLGTSFLSSDVRGLCEIPMGSHQRGHKIYVE